MLCVVNRQLRVVHQVLTFSVRCMETKLLLVDAVGEAEEGVVRALHHAHNLSKTAIIFVTLVISRHRHEVFQLLSVDEGVESDA